MLAAQESTTNSTTPILDSGVLPRRIRKLKLRDLITGFLIGIIPGFLLIVGKQAKSGLSLGLDLLSFCCVLGLAITVHELGHLLAGWFVGFRFSCIQIGPLSLRVEYGMLKIRVRREMTAFGYAGMHVNRLRRLRRRCLIYISAGPAANLLSIPVVLLLVNSVLPSLGNSWVATPAAQFVYISLLFGVVNLVPLGSTATNDGSRISMLLKSRDLTRRWLCIVALGNVRDQGTRAKLWKSTWLRAASCMSDMSLDAFSGSLLAYISSNDRKNVPAAAIHLERCLQLAVKLPESTRDFVVSEAAFFSAWFRSDALLSDRWFVQVRKPDLLPSLVKVRVRIATSCAKCDMAGAITDWEAGRGLIDRTTAGTANTLLKESWAEWREEIEDRKNDCRGTDEVQIPR